MYKYSYLKLFLVFNTIQVIGNHCLSNVKSRCDWLLQEIDGQSLMLLSLPTIQEHLELKLGPAVKLCHQIERVKIAFFEQFASADSHSS